jgi:GH18 family chitinase
MYGRGWKSVDETALHGTYPGLFQHSDDSVRRRVPKGTWDGGKWGNTGVYAYWDILLNYGGDGASTDYELVLVDPVPPLLPARPYGPYVVGAGHFIGFDSQASLSAKMNYLVSEGLGGVMFWDMPGDLSRAQVVQGFVGAEAYPDQSLIHHLARQLEALSPSGN